MDEQRRPSDRLEVRLVARDQVPVRHVGNRGERIRPEPGDLVGHDHDGDGQRRDEQQEQRGQQPASSAQPEPDRVDPAPVPVFAEEEGRDQVPADHEEDLDTEEAALRNAEPGVVGQDRQDGDRPQPVETGQVRQGPEGAVGRSSDGGRGGVRMDRDRLRHVPAGWPMWGRATPGERRSGVRPAPGIVPRRSVRRPAR